MKNFDDIYEKLQLYHSVELNNLRNKCKTKILISKYYSLFIFVIFSILEGLNYFIIYKNYKFLFYLLSLIIIVSFLYFFIKSFSYKKIKYPSSEQIKIFNNNDITNYINYFKNNLIKDLVHYVNNNIIYSSSNGLNEDIYLSFFDGLDEKKYTKYISEDYMKFNNTWIYDVSTYRNESSNLKKEKKVFSGLISFSKTNNKSNFMISSHNYKNKCQKIGKYYLYGNIKIDNNLLNVFNHFIDYSGYNFDLICKDGCLSIRAHFNCMFDPNIYIGHMPKKLLYIYYRNLYEFIILINSCSKILN